MVSLLKPKQMMNVSAGIGGDHNNEEKQKLAEVEGKEKTVLDLFQYVKKEDKEELQKLLKRPTFDVTATVDKDGNIPLHYAAKGNDSKILEMLLERNAETVNKENNNKRTPLHKAAKYNKANMAQKLIERNADLQAEDSNNLTPLLLAIKNNSYDVVSLLFGQNGSIRGNEQRKNAIKLATLKNSVEILDMIFKHKKKSKVDDADDEEKGEEINDYDDSDDENSPQKEDSHDEHERNGVWMSWQDDEFYILFYNHELQPIHIAAQNGYLESLALLLENGADIFSTGENRNTALHFAVAHEKIKVVELLLTKYGKLLIDKTDKDKNTALHYAIRNERIIELLLKAGASMDINVKMKAVVLACLLLLSIGE